MTPDEVMRVANATTGQWWMDEAHTQRFAAIIYARGQRDMQERAAKFFDLNDTNLFWGSQAARHIRALEVKP